MDQAELRRRLRAARELRGLSQREMSQLGADRYGLGEQELARAERGGKDGLSFTPARMMIACKVLRVPEWWFTEPDTDVLLGVRPARPLSPDESREVLELLLAGHDRAVGRGRPKNSIRPVGGDRPDRDRGAGGA